MKDFAGKVAVVTGGGSGIGRALAHAFADRGMKIALADVERSALDTVAEELRSGGTEVLACVVDVADRRRLGEFADNVYDTLGGAHVLCNNAGVGTGGPMSEITLEAWDWVLDVNLKAVVSGIHFFLPRMIASNEPCHIVNTASIAGMMCGPFMGPYNASKYAVVAISETLALELAETQVDVSVLCPAWVDTKIAESERNAPPGIATSGATGTDPQLRNEITELLRTGMKPEAIAARVVETIETGGLYILTHADFMPILEERFRAIMAAAPVATP